MIIRPTFPRKLAFLCVPVFSLLSASAVQAAHLSPFTENAIIGGEVVTSDSRVFKMAVHLKASVTIGTESGTARCTGTLIAKDLVLTAAHCVKDIDTNGTYHSISATFGNGQTIPAKTWLAHPGYQNVVDGGGLWGGGTKRPIKDIALVRLSSPVGEGTRIAEIPTGAPSASVQEDMVVAGFGQTNPNDNTSSGVLYFAWTEGLLQSVSGGADYQIEMTGVQPCRGDSGGPLFRADPNHLVVLGVTSHVLGNCERQARAISVWHHLSWIRSTAREMNSVFAQ